MKKERLANNKKTPQIVEIRKKLNCSNNNNNNNILNLKLGIHFRIAVKTSFPDSLSGEEISWERG